MSYSILRVQKMKTTAIKGIQFHNQRERESETNPDINKADSHLNYDLINDKKINYNERIDQLIEKNVVSQKKIRKDAVKLTECLVTSDEDFFKNISPAEQKRFFKTAYEFLADRYGERNLIYATVHLDERTPHMHVGFVPVTEDGRLSAKDVIGNKLKLVGLQDAFNEHLKSEGFDLERGVSSNRKHLETAKYKAITLSYKDALEGLQKDIDRKSRDQGMER
ncbi:MobV family relaxase [Bacillus sp. JJ722]|uniref:MobV family relaxase n=1 Tax=Bacillus sp. JJ722 TaxID=3122973 RepID=UPI002FFF52ED